MKFVALIIILSVTVSAHSKIPFVLKRTDAKARRAEIQPYVAPIFIVSIESDVLALTNNEVLQCKVGARERKAVVDGKDTKLVEMVLECGDKKFIVKGVDFEGN